MLQYPATNRLLMKMRELLNMKTLYLLRYSQLTQSNMQASIEAFVKKTDLNPNLIYQAARQEGGLPLNSYTPEEINQISHGAIYLFKTGKITETEFVTRMNQTIGTNLNFDTFKECWNAMFTIQPKTVEFLRKIENLQKENSFSIHVVGNTNSMHDNYINEQFRQENINLEMTHTYSFEEGKFDPEPLKKLIDMLSEGFNIIDLRNTADLLEEFSKAKQQQAATKLGCRFTPQ